MGSLQSNGRYRTHQGFVVILREIIDGFIPRLSLIATPLGFLIDHISSYFKATLQTTAADPIYYKNKILFHVQNNLFHD